MIPAPPGIVARYKSKGTRPDGTPYEYTDDVPVIAFDDEGEAMVLGKRGLVQATSFGNFVDVTEGDQANLVSIIPATGWRVEFTEPDGSKRSDPLFAWGLRGDGDVVPLDVDQHGWVEPLRGLGGTWRVYHPDADPTP